MGQSSWREQVERWKYSPLHFVLEAIFRLDESAWQPWVPGTPRPDTAPPGPELWQGNFLRDVGAAIHEGKRRFSVRAGHGVGKTAIEAWLVLWFVLFWRPLKMPITANSQDQLRDVVWSEIAHWWRELPQFLKDQIEVNVERVTAKGDPEAAFAVARTARPEKPEALQGFHSDNLAFAIEEASGVEDVIFEVASGALSTPHAWVFMFANPTRPQGYFWRSHTVNRDTWRCYHVPCTHSYRVAPTYATDVAREYGEQSNVYRVRVLGEFPLSEDDSVIPLGLILAAQDRDVVASEAGIVWGLDVARFGDDTTALAKRRGNTLLAPVREWRKYDLMQTAGVIMREWNETPIGSRPAAINVDVIGLGSGVVDRLRELGLPVVGVNVGEAASSAPERYLRLRDELWFKAREWFDSRAVWMPKDEGLAAELVGPKYKVESSGKLKVESKDDMKKRGVKSPNKADAFCLTFAGGDHNMGLRQMVATMAYDPFKVDSVDFERMLGRQELAGVEWRPW
jgi:hypothetical protein